MCGPLKTESGLEALPDQLIGNFMVEQNLFRFDHSSELFRAAIGLGRFQLDKFRVNFVSEHLADVYASLEVAHRVVNVVRQEAGPGAAALSIELFSHRAVKTGAKQ